MITYQEVSNRMEFSALTNDELEDLGKRITATIFRHLGMVKFVSRGIKNYDFTVGQQHTLCAYGEEFSLGIKNRKDGIEVYRFQEELRGFVVYVGLMDFSGAGSKSVGKSFKDSIRRELMKNMRKMDKKKK